MSNIFRFIGAFCTMAAALGIIGILIPNGSMSKSVRFAFCLCFLAFLLTFSKVLPLESIDFNMESSEENYEEMRHSATKAVFAKALKSADISFNKLEIETSKNENGDIIITKVTVWSNDSAEKIKNAIGGEYKVCVIGD